MKSHTCPPPCMSSAKEAGNWVFLILSWGDRVHMLGCSPHTAGESEGAA